MPLGYDVLKTPERVLKLLRGLGLDGVDIPGNSEKVVWKPLKKLARSWGLEMPEVVGAWGAWHAGVSRDLAGSDEGTRARAITYSKKCIELTYSLEIPLFQVSPAPGTTQYPLSNIPLATLKKNFARATGEICSQATDRGVTILLEPLNRLEGYPGLLNTVGDALTVIEELGGEGLGILADLFHMNLEEVSISDALRDAGKKLRHVHVADSNRQAPGTGHIDFMAVMKSLMEIEYGGFVSLDCVMPKPDLKTYVTYSLGYLRETEKTLDTQRRVCASAGAPARERVD